MTSCSPMSTLLSRPHSSLWRRDGAVTKYDLWDSWERDDLPEMLLGERLVYMEMRAASGSKGKLRFSAVDLSHKLGVNRQSIIKHVDSLMAKGLVRRESHGRYTVYAKPYSLLDAAKDYRATLKPGDEWNTLDLAEIMWGEQLDPASMDPRVNEVIDYTMMLEKAGRLEYDEIESVWTVPRTP